ncbi:metal-dependent hydrolase [Halorubrum lipolyticum]|uniref:Membrane-bound metal-dependent hydrolase n=1 Tax=Halorubrum lipolyticum DSM 21995 TaxID=1227482 RepID=M0NP30_9EURY|nr:metal-dependent hydrolase [Halorubrum lipolyticum]EMA58405.1 membrane-bound metal-dependent hydrolase [Halorubrum lipolyticum DSM 21995]
MRPIEHFIVALFLVSFYLLVRTRRLPSLELGAVAFVGSQFPDLVDKPLAHQLHLIPTGRVFMHSLPFAIPVWLVVLAYGWKTDRRRGGVVFVLAHASHLIADNYAALASGRVPSDLLWPFLAPVPRPPAPYWAGPNSINLHLFTAFSVAVLAVTAYYLIADVTEQLRLSP